MFYKVLSRGEWVPAVPIPGTILVNLGDLMQFWTSDRYVATVQVNINEHFDSFLYIYAVFLGPPRPSPFRRDPTPFPAPIHRFFRPR